MTFTVQDSSHGIENFHLVCRQDSSSYFKQDQHLLSQVGQVFNVFVCSTYNSGRGGDLCFIHFRTGPPDFKARQWTDI